MTRDKRNKNVTNLRVGFDTKWRDLFLPETCHTFITQYISISKTPAPTLILYLLSSIAK